MKTKQAFFDFLKYVALLIGTFVVFFPLYSVFVGAFKTRQEFYTNRLSLPESWNFENFRIAWEKGDLALGLGNTLFILVVAIAGNVLIGSMSAYALGRFDFKGKNLIIGSYLVAAVIPLITTQVVTYSVIKALGLYNTYGAPIALYLGADVIQLTIYLQFIRNIPYELDEAAMMEGASLFKIFRSVIFPLLGPATATVVILKFITIYNDFYVPYLYMPDRSLRTVATAILSFVGPNAARMEVISAYILLIFIPTIVMFLFMQRFIFSGVTSGAVKS
jgi:multiple sugar transport system permease protein